MTNLQQQAMAILESQAAKGYKVRAISPYSICTKCGRETGTYSGRDIQAKTFKEAIDAVGTLEKEVEVFNNLQIGESADDKDIIAIEIIGHAVVNGCRKCNEKKGENEMTKMKKAELIEEVLRLRKENEELKAKMAPKNVSLNETKKEKVVTLYKNQVLDYNGTKVAVTRMSVDGLDTGLIKFNKFQWKYSWNRSKYNKPIIKGEGFKYEKERVDNLCALLQEVFKTSEVYTKKEKKLPEIEEVSDDVFEDEMINA